jgi:hypothetical protein
VISGRFHSDEKVVPFEMFGGGSGSPSRKGLIQESEVNDLIGRARRIKPELAILELRPTVLYMIGSAVRGGALLGEMNK